MHKGRVASKMLYLVGMLLSVNPPAVCTLMYFPLWQNRDTGAVISGIALLLLLVCALPLFRLLRRTVKSPSAPLIWFLLFVLFFMLSRIAEEMRVVTFVGFTSNTVGMIFFKLSEKLLSEENKE